METERTLAYAPALPPTKLPPFLVQWPRLAPARASPAAPTGRRRVAQQGSREKRDLQLCPADAALVIVPLPVHSVQGDWTLWPRSPFPLIIIAPFCRRRRLQWKQQLAFHRALSPVTRAAQRSVHVHPLPCA